MNYIYGEKFQTLFPYAVYAHTHEAGNILHKLSKSKRKHVLITHNSDGEIVSSKNCRWDSIDSSLKTDNIMWFGQNLNVETNNIYPIPIGLENPHWHPYKFDILDRVRAYNIERNDLLYINHDCKINTEERQRIYTLDWATCKYGTNGQNYEEYLIDLASHKFVASPKGNGWDCHRTWEALYMGCIPILIKSRFSQLLYHDLAYLVWDWNLSSDRLISDYNETYKNISWDKLDFYSWQNFIDTKSRAFFLS